MRVINKILIIFVMGLVGSNYPMKLASLEPMPITFSKHHIILSKMENQEEIWKDVKGYEGLYQVSNLGRVKSITRTDRFNRPVNGGILKASLDTFGYLKIGFSINGKKKYKQIHQVVAESFLDHKPCKKIIVVNHKDFNRQNNNIKNLELVTQRENTNQKHLKSSSKYTGVSWNKSHKKWVSRIEVDGKSIYLGIFDSETEASSYYENALTSIKNNDKIKVKRKEYSSQYKGVYWDKKSNKWCAQIRIKGKAKHIGHFTNEIDAHNAYQYVKKNLKK